MKNQDLFAGDYNIDTPERVAFDYTIADIGNRFLAALLDVILVGAALVGLNLLLFAVLSAGGADPMAASLDEESLGWGAGLAIALYAALNFFVIWGYFMLLELKWNGQTAGKRVVRIRVVRVDGSPAAPLDVAIRNLVRIVDFLPSAYLIGFIVMLFNSQARRLGDLAGGTLVVKADAPVTLEQLVQSALASRTHTAELAAPVSEPPAVEPGEQSSPAEALPLDVRGLRPSEYALILDVLGRDAKTPLQDGLLVRLATAIAGRIGYSGDVGGDPRPFLRLVAEAYRRRG